MHLLPWHGSSRFSFCRQQQQIRFSFLSPCIPQFNTNQQCSWRRPCLLQSFTARGSPTVFFHMKSTFSESDTHPETEPNARFPPIPHDDYFELCGRSGREKSSRDQSPRVSPARFRWPGTAVTQRYWGQLELSGGFGFWEIRLRRQCAHSIAISTPSSPPTALLPPPPPPVCLVGENPAWSVPA